MISRIQEKVLQTIERRVFRDKLGRALCTCAVLRWRRQWVGGKGILVMMRRECMRVSNSGSIPPDPTHFLRTFCTRCLRQRVLLFTRGSFFRTVFWPSTVRSAMIHVIRKNQDITRYRMTLLSKTFVETKPETTFSNTSTCSTTSTHSRVVHKKHHRWTDGLVVFRKEQRSCIVPNTYSAADSAKLHNIVKSKARCTMTTNSDQWNKIILKHQCETDGLSLMILGDSRFEIGMVSLIECCHDISNSSEFLTNLRLDSFEPGILDCISKGTNDDGKPHRRN